MCTQTDQLKLKSIHTAKYEQKTNKILKRSNLVIIIRADYSYNSKTSRGANIKKN